jgi:UDPglucose 6-dehydrogenase
MKIAIAGLWHLGTVTAVCLANAGHDVTGYDPDLIAIDRLQQEQIPVIEPGLPALLAQAVQSGKLVFSADRQILHTAEVVWVTFDTPVNDDATANPSFVIDQIIQLLPVLQAGTLVLISSQLPVGSTRKLEKYCNQHYPENQITFGYSPENLCLGKAVESFIHPDRIIVGLQNEDDQERVKNLLNPWTENIIWMSIESAEMTKHALNAFLAMSVVFINELSVLCEQVNADPKAVEQGLKSDARIGAKAYLRPGLAISGGTLERDVNYLIELNEEYHTASPLLYATKESNRQHQQWAYHKIVDTFKTLQNKTITMLGLTYKAGVNTLRGSGAIKVCQKLSEKGAKIIAYDPTMTVLPDHLSQFIHLKQTVAEAIAGVDGIVIGAECPEFTAQEVRNLLCDLHGLCIFDQGGFLADIFARHRNVTYFSVGGQV